MENLWQIWKIDGKHEIYRTFIENMKNLWKFYGKSMENMNILIFF